MTKSKQLADFVDCVSDTCLPSAAGTDVYIGLEHIDGGAFEISAVGHPDNVTSAKNRFRRGDILYGKLRPYLDKAVLADRDGICSTDILVFRPKRDATSVFVLGHIHSQVFLQHATATTKGLNHPRTSWHGLSTFQCFAPPRPEQKKVAAILWKLQRAISIQDRLIAATRDLKQSAMQRLFAHGLRGEPLKDTDIGQIPLGWKLARCETVTKAITVGVVVRPASHYVENGVPAFRSFNVREDFLDDKNLVYFDQGVNDTLLSKSKLFAGDVLIVRTGYPGTSCVVPQHYDGANCIDLVLVRPDREIVLPEFLSRFFNSHLGRTQTLSSSYGLAQKHLNVGAVKGTLVVVPEIDEQCDIAAALSTIDRKLAHHQRKRAALNDLFQTALHLLMTAQVRVADLDIDTSEVTSFAPKGEAA